MTVLLETRIVNALPLHRSRVHVGGSRAFRAVDKIHGMIKNSSRDSPAHTCTRTSRTQRVNAPDNDCPGCLLPISSRSRLSDAEAIEPSD